MTDKYTIDDIEIGFRHRGQTDEPMDSYVATFKVIKLMNQAYEKGFKDRDFLISPIPPYHIIKEENEKLKEELKITRDLQTISKSYEIDNDRLKEENEQIKEKNIKLTGKLEYLIGLEVQNGGFKSRIDQLERENKSLKEKNKFLENKLSDHMKVADIVAADNFGLLRMNTESLQKENESLKEKFMVKKMTEITLEQIEKFRQDVFEEYASCLKSALIILNEENGTEKCKYYLKSTLSSISYKQENLYRYIKGA